MKTSSRGTIADRINDSLGARGISAHALRIALRSHSVKGASLGAVYRYVNGEATPTVAFLEAAAEVLGVRKEWLTFGSGGATEAATAVTTEAETESARALPFRKITVPLGRTQLIGVRQVAQRLGETPHAVYRMVRERLIPHVRLGSKVKFDPDQLEQWIAAGGTPLPQRGE